MPVPVYPHLVKRANLAKMFYDMAKVAFAGLVVGGLMRSSTADFAAGIGATIALALTAWIIDKEA